MAELDVFTVQGQLIDDYAAFTSAFVEPLDPRLAAFVKEELANGRQWPDPWLSLNPSFAPGGTASDLVDQGLLHEECDRIFRIKRDRGDLNGRPIPFHRHQTESFEAAASGQSYVLTTGTGSGKSLSYIVPIVDRVLRQRSASPDQGGSRPGVKAIVVYPMNALANSQWLELEKFLCFGYGENEAPVTFERYTGQESADERRRILADPPDILLTNYVMLDLVLTRPDERKHLIRAAKGLQFLVLDELHTYRGRQGADVAMLVRRVRDACESPGLQLVGTSATMASTGAIADRQAEVARVATRMFGATVTSERVIGETLVRATSDGGPTSRQLADATRINASTENPTRPYADLAADPLAAWVETVFGLDIDTNTGRLIRSAPTTVLLAAKVLATESGVDELTCARAIRAMLLAGSQARHPELDRPLFAFRLHQFISKGDSVFVSLGPEATRHISGQYQLRVPNEPEKALLPLGFCRECGQEYYVVARTTREGNTTFVPRADRDASGGDTVTGYLYVSTDYGWPDDPLAENRVPDHWLVENEDGTTLPIPSKQKYLPRSVWVAPDGREVEESAGTGLAAWFVPTPFAFCLRCQVSYEQVRGSDFAKLATLDQEGRSSAMTVISASVVRTLREIPAEDLAADARKLLTFVDNRQDASLQAGHFNDFVQVAQLRGALSRGMQAHGGELSHEVVAQAVATALGLEMEDFAANPEAKRSMRDLAERALRQVIEYRLYTDLRRGWRVTMPNLEQVGLLHVDYVDLAEIAEDSDDWVTAHPLLRSADAGIRAELMRILLDEMRRVLAIDVDCLTEPGFERLVRDARQHLREPWTTGETENVEAIGTIFPRSGRPGASRNDLHISGRSAFGRYVRKVLGLRDKQAIADAQTVIVDLLLTLEREGLVTAAVETKDGDTGYRLKASSLRWCLGDGTMGAPDPLRKVYDDNTLARVNPFFLRLYREVAETLTGLHAKEHTAQVPPELRAERENAFRAGTALPLLYCSPTMELGVDIASLNAVGMRNVPPTPANYAQRSGRAGRSGQPALVVTYCAAGNAHDSYWFRHSRDMVAGSVIAPRLDLANEDLVRSHMHAIWLAETGQSLGAQLTGLVDAGGDTPSLALLPEIAARLHDQGTARRSVARATAVLDQLRATWTDADHLPWLDDDWVTGVITRAPEQLDRALDRWRNLYRNSLNEYLEQGRFAVDPATDRRKRQTATARQHEARDRLNLLRNEDSNAGQTDFYSYRYFASEGFLPGYSFPRLPLAAYIPGGRATRGRPTGSYLQRPRFLAINEFGPGALIYHEGARYEVTRVQLPRSPDGTPGVEAEEARRCEQCGYHHPVSVGVDRCESCDAELMDKTYGLIRLQTVHTRRRERISSDEEERRRSGFELETSYRFNDHGNRPGRIDATTSSADGNALLDLVYGDAATVRVANVGRRRRKNPNNRGFWIDVHEGRWLSDKQATDSTVDTDDLDAAEDVAAKQKVIPYVEDTSNVVILRFAAPLSEVVATTMRFAFERGAETAFQLEDSELASQALPEPDGRGRALFTESAEGGAGVLRRLVTEPDAVARVARTALGLCHFDPDTGEDLGQADGARERCELGCYDCLLSYGNQNEHGLIDRHQVRDLLLELTHSSTVTGAGGRSRSSTRTLLDSMADSGLERDFVGWLDEHGYRLPNRTQVSVPDARARPDLVYDLPTGTVAVWVDGPHHDLAAQSERDTAAEERLLDAGWTASVRIRHDQDRKQAVAKFPSVFGTPRGDHL